MCGNDRSATVDCNLNLYKALELALATGKNCRPTLTASGASLTRPPPMLRQAAQQKALPPLNSYLALCRRAGKIYNSQNGDLYDELNAVRAEFSPTPYLSALVRGCAESGLDINQGGAELKFITIEAVTFATTVDSLLAIKYLVFDQQLCTMGELKAALQANWVGYEKLQAAAINKAPKYGRDDEEADALACRVMDLWAEETWRYKSAATGAQYRPGMLSWNYWISSGYILPASPDGRGKDSFFPTRSAR
jgi:trans-4-hydroxy-L-proline dehydratase